MKIHATLPEKGRDLRLDLFRGIANWAIFLDHIPDNVVNWVTTRNYGFSDAADLFVFISGYTASFVYAKMMLERGFIVGATRLTKRVWQLYVAHVILFVIYIVAIGYVAQRYTDPEIINEFNVAGLVDNPIRNAAPGPAAQVQAGQSRRAAALHRADGIVSAGAVDDAAQARPDDAGFASCCSLPRASSAGTSPPIRPAPGISIPYCWQLLFVFGAWFALGGAESRTCDHQVAITLYFCIAYLFFALIMTMAGKFPDFGALFPNWLYSTPSIPTTRPFLAPYRFIHFVVIAFFVTRFVPKNDRRWNGRASIPRSSAASNRSRYSASACSCPLSRISADAELGLVPRADASSASAASRS